MKRALFRGTSHTRFVRTGETRPPKKGEFYLSGAFPIVYDATCDYGEDSVYQIMRPATDAESTCPCCKQDLPLHEEEF